MPLIPLPTNARHPFSIAIRSSRKWWKSHFIPSVVWGVEFVNYRKGWTRDSNILWAVVESHGSQGLDEHRQFRGQLAKDGAMDTPWPPNPGGWSQWPTQGKCPFLSPVMFGGSSLVCQKLSNSQKWALYVMWRRWREGAEFGLWSE